ATPALVVVGFLMMQQVANIDWADIEIAFPAFLTIVLMPFTYSITAGIGAGFLAYVLLKLVRGKWGTVHPRMWFIAAMFLTYFPPGPIRDLLGVWRTGGRRRVRDGQGGRRRVRGRDRPPRYRGPCGDEVSGIVSRGNELG